jgi:hypothetical protein
VFKEERMNQQTQFSTSSPGVIDFLITNWKKLLIISSLSGLIALGVSF